MSHALSEARKHVDELEAMGDRLEELKEEEEDNWCLVDDIEHAIKTVRTMECTWKVRLKELEDKIR